jgi:putative membrane protein
MSQPRILKQATISPKAVQYNLVSITVALGCTIVGIPLLLIALPISHWYWTRYYDRLKVILTSRELKVHRGILNREEKSIPLEKITDLAVFEGPIMRRMGVKGIRVETAGQSGSGGALVRLIGIAETDDFRDIVLAQRDRVTDRESDVATSASGVPSATADANVLAALHDIRDTVQRMEQLLQSKE